MHRLYALSIHGIIDLCLYSGFHLGSNAPVFHDKIFWLVKFDAWFDIIIAAY